MSGYNFTIVGTSGYFYNKGERKCLNSDKKNGRNESDAPEEKHTGLFCKIKT